MLPNNIVRLPAIGEPVD